MSENTLMDDEGGEEETLAPLRGLSDSEFSSKDSADEELCIEAGSGTKQQFR